MEATDVILLLLSLLLVVLAGLCAAADAAIFAASVARVEEAARAGKRGAGSLLAILADRPRYTNLLLLLRVTCELAATVLAALVAQQVFGLSPWVTVAVVAIMIVVTYVVTGVLPRTLGRQHPYAVGPALAPIVKVLGKVLSPISRLLIAVGNALTPGRGFRHGPFASEVELRELVDMAGVHGVVEDTEREMLHSVFALGDTIAREVMVPRTEVIWIEATKSLRQGMQLACRTGFSRIPVIGEDVDDIVGVLYVKDLISTALDMDAGAPGGQISTVMRDAVFVPDSKAVDDLLAEMQRSRTHFAVVVDEYGGTAGIVTIEDIIEEIVGEITDEYDADSPAPITELPDGTIRVSARLPVEDLGEYFDIQLPATDVETVGGLLAQILGRVPLPGATARIDGLELTGEGGPDRRGRPKVTTVLVQRNQAESDTHDALP